MDALAQNYLDYKTVTFEELAGKGVKQLAFNQLKIEDAGHYAAEDADITLRLHQFFWPQLEQIASLKSVFETRRFRRTARCYRWHKVLFASKQVSELWNALYTPTILVPAILSLHFHPIAMLFDEGNEFLHGLFFRNVFLDYVFLFVKGDFAGTGSYITIIGVGHFTRTVHNTAHDADFHSLQMRSARANLGGGFL